MFGLIGVRRGQLSTGSLLIHCPACKAQNVVAETYTYAEQLVLFHFVPLAPRSSTYWLTCSRCRETLRSPLPASEFHDLPPEVIAEYIKHRVSPIKKLLAVLAIVFFFMPLLGLLLA